MEEFFRRTLVEFFPGILIGTLYLVFFFAFYAKNSRRRLMRRRFFRAVKEILEGESDVAIQEKQLNLIYKKLTEIFSSVSGRIRGLTDFLEYFIYAYDTRGAEFFKRFYSVEVDKPLRDRAFTLLNHLKEKNPFSTLPSKEANLLRVIKEATDSGNKALVDNSLRQLAEDIEVLDNAIKNGERRNRTAYIVSIIGVALTTVFGILSMLQVLSK